MVIVSDQSGCSNDCVALNESKISLPLLWQLKSQNLRQSSAPSPSPPPKKKPTKSQCRVYEGVFVCLFICVSVSTCMCVCVRASVCVYGRARGTGDSCDGFLAVGGWVECGHTKLTGLIQP